MARWGETPESREWVHLDRIAGSLGRADGDLGRIASALERIADCMERSEEDGAKVKAMLEAELTEEPRWKPSTSQSARCSGASRGASSPTWWPT